MTLLIPWLPLTDTSAIYDAANPEYSNLKCLSLINSYIDNPIYTDLEQFVLFDIGLLEKIKVIDEWTFGDYSYHYDLALAYILKDEELCIKLTKSYLHRTNNFFSNHPEKNVVTAQLVNAVVNAYSLPKLDAWFQTVQTLPLLPIIDGSRQLALWVLMKALESKDPKYFYILTWGYQKKLADQDALATYMLQLLYAMKDISQLKYLVQEKRCLHFLKSVNKSPVLDSWLKRVMHRADLPVALNQDIAFRKELPMTINSISSVNELLDSFLMLTPILFTVDELYPPELKVLATLTTVIPIHHNREGRIVAGMPKFPIAEVGLKKDADSIIYQIPNDLVQRCFPYEKQVIHVLERANANDWISVLYVGIMLVEPLLRKIALQNGEPTSTLDKENNVGTFGVIYGRAKAYLKDSTNLILDRYVEKEGFNLRNKAAHGKYTDDDLYNTTGVYGFIALLVLLLLIRDELE